MGEPRKVTIVREEWYPVFNVRAVPGPGRPRALVIELTADEAARYEACIAEFDAVQAILRAKLLAAENPRGPLGDPTSSSSRSGPGRPFQNADPPPS